MTSGIEIPGIKLGVAIAGLAGGVVSLSYVKPLSKWQGCLPFSRERYALPT